MLAWLDRLESLDFEIMMKRSVVTEGGDSPGSDMADDVCRMTDRQGSFKAIMTCDTCLGTQSKTMWGEESLQQQVSGLTAAPALGDLMFSGVYSFIPPLLSLSLSLFTASTSDVLCTLPTPSAK